MDRRPIVIALQGIGSRLICASVETPRGLDLDRTVRVRDVRRDLRLLCLVCLRCCSREHCCRSLDGGVSDLVVLQSVGSDILVDRLVLLRLVHKRGQRLECGRRRERREIHLRQLDFIPFVQVVEPGERWRLVACDGCTIIAIAKARIEGRQLICARVVRRRVRRLVGGRFLNFLEIFSEGLRLVLVGLPDHGCVRAAGPERCAGGLPAHECRGRSCRMSTAVSFRRPVCRYASSPASSPRRTLPTQRCTSALALHRGRREPRSASSS